MENGAGWLEKRQVSFGWNTKESPESLNVRVINSYELCLSAVLQAKLGLPSFLSFRKWCGAIVTPVSEKRLSLEAFHGASAGFLS